MQESDKSTDVVFDKDEMRLIPTDPNWTEEDLLRQEGVYYLKDVTRMLRISSAEIKKAANQLEASGKSPWQEIGVRKTWTHWIVRMTVFSKYFRKLEPSRIHHVDPRWDANEMFSQTGRFYLAEVCEKIPFTPYQIRYQARRNENSREEFGVWKDPNHKSYLVRMEIFSTWIKAIWQEAGKTKKGKSKNG